MYVNGIDIILILTSYNDPLYIYIILILTAYNDPLYT